jgi:hypothetical protein
MRKVKFNFRYICVFESGGDGFYGKGRFSAAFIVGIECFVGLGFCFNRLRSAMGGHRRFFMEMYSCCLDNFI